MSPEWQRALDVLRVRRVGLALAPATIAWEQRSLRALHARMGPSPREVTREAVVDLLAQRLEEIAPSSAARELSALRTLFGVLVEEGLAELDPTEGLEVKVPERDQLVLSQADVEALLAAGSEVVRARRSPEVNRAVALRNRAALELLFGAAVRASELCGALVTDLDLSGPSLFVRRAKRGKPAALPLPGAVSEHLRAYLVEARPLLLRLRDASEGALIVSERGGRLTPNHLLRLVRQIAARAGVDAHPHAIRRTVATGLVRNGASLPAVQALLGHRRLDTTQRYVRVSVEELRASVTVLDRDGRG